jgi:hypothetical protein
MFDINHELPPCPPEYPERGSTSGPYCHCGMLIYLVKKEGPQPRCINGHVFARYSDKQPWRIRVTRLAYDRFVRWPNG